MKVEPIPGEPARFYVSSDSRPDVTHVVDLDWREEKWHKPKAVCSCEMVQAKGFKVCKHIEAVIKYGWPDKLK